MSQWRIVQFTWAIGRAEGLGDSLRRRIKLTLSWHPSKSWDQALFVPHSICYLGITDLGSSVCSYVCASWGGRCCPLECSERKGCTTPGKKTKLQWRKLAWEQVSKCQAIERGSVVTEADYGGSFMLVAARTLPMVIHVKCSGFLQPQPLRTVQLGPVGFQCWHTKREHAGALEHHEYLLLLP